MLKNLFRFWKNSFSEKGLTIYLDFERIRFLKRFNNLFGFWKNSFSKKCLKIYLDFERIRFLKKV